MDSGLKSGGRSAAPIKNLISLAGTNEHELISRNVKDLENLTNQVLGKYHSSNCEKINQDNLHVILSDIKMKFQDKINIKIDLSIEFDWYYVDSVLFVRTFINLISNSIKANATEVKIHGYFKNNFLTIDISDNGNGISEKLQPYIFDKGITSNKSKGNGLGLCFIEENFSEIGLSIKLLLSKPNCTVFQIKIPLNEIILIDDNPLVRDTWMVLANKVGIELKAYAKSRDIDFKKIIKSTPIFIDRDLGDEDGLNVVYKLLDLGFKNAVIATGEAKQINPQIRQVRKEFPAFL